MTCSVNLVHQVIGLGLALQWMIGSMPKAMAFDKSYVGCPSFFLLVPTKGTN